MNNFEPAFFLCLLIQNVREPSAGTQCSPTASIPKSGSSGMIQYLQSWFPGWGGWYGESQDPDRPEELLTSPSSWDILGEKICAAADILDNTQFSQIVSLYVQCL